MAQVLVPRQARQDLIAIRRYIREELANPPAADRVLRALRSAVESLRTFPRKGKPLDAVLSVHTAYRFLICEGYCVFYLDNGQQR